MFTEGTILKDKDIRITLLYEELLSLTVKYGKETTLNINLKDVVFKI